MPNHQVLGAAGCGGCSVGQMSRYHLGFQFIRKADRRWQWDSAVRWIGSGDSCTTEWSWERHLFYVKNGTTIVPVSGCMVQKLTQVEAWNSFWHQYLIIIIFGEAPLNKKHQEESVLFDEDHMLDFRHVVVLRYQRKSGAVSWRHGSVSQRAAWVGGLNLTVITFFPWSAREERLY